MRILSEHVCCLRKFLPVLAACISTNFVGCAGRNAGAPPPPPRPLLQAIPAVPHSTLRLPVEVDLDYLSSVVVAAVPHPLSQKTQQRRVALGGSLPFAPTVGVEFRHRAQLERLDLRLDGDQLQATARVAFAVGGSLGGGAGFGVGLASCGERPGEPAAAIDFTLRGTLSWEDDAHIRLRPLPWEMRWVRPCELTAFKVRLEDVIDLPVVREAVQKAVTQAVQKIPEAIQLRPLAEKAWTALAQPREIAPGVFLLVRPDSVSAGPLVGTGKSMRSTLTVVAHPVLTDSLPPLSGLPPMPPLRIAPPADESFQLEAQVTLPLTTVDSLLTSSLSERTFAAGGRTVRISRARLYGGGDMAILGVTLVEPFHGDIFLRGRPLYDSVRNALVLGDVDFDLQTRSFLVKSANYLVHGRIQEAIAKAAAIDLSRELPRLSDLHLPAGDVGELELSLRSLRPMGISLDQERLRAWMRTDGKAVFKVGRTRQNLSKPGTSK